MKNIIKLLGIAALVAIIGFSMIACGDGGGTGDPMPKVVMYTGTAGSDEYTLLITEAPENRAAYTPMGGDKYVLTVGSKKSTGTVNLFESLVLTLKPASGGTFTVTVHATNGITAMSGTITWVGGGTDTAPATLSGGSTVDDVNATYAGTWNFTIKGLNATVTVTGNKWAIKMTGNDDSGTFTMDGNVATLRSNYFNGAIVGTATLTSNTTMILELVSPALNPGTYNGTKQ